MKKLLSILLVTVLIFAGCSNNESNAETNAEESASNELTSEEVKELVVSSTDKVRGFEQDFELTANIPDDGIVAEISYNQDDKTFGIRYLYDDPSEYNGIEEFNGVYNLETEKFDVADFTFDDGSQMDAKNEISSFSELTTYESPEVVANGFISEVKVNSADDLVHEDGKYSFTSSSNLEVEITEDGNNMNFKMGNYELIINLK